MKIIRNIKWFSNIQLVIYTTVLFGVLIFFVDRDNFIASEKLKTKIENLEKQRDYLLNEIREDSSIIKGIETNDEFLEKYARENYLMLRTGETVFVVEEVPAQDTTVSSTSSAAPQTESKTTTTKEMKTTKEAVSSQKGVPAKP